MCFRERYDRLAAVPVILTLLTGSLTLNLTPEEIDAITQSGTITRSLMQYNALCDDSTVNFDAIVQGAGKVIFVNVLFSEKV
jgi:hypothetical protein